MHYRETYEAAAAELESLLRQQERIEGRILNLRKTMIALLGLMDKEADQESPVLRGALTAGQVSQGLRGALTNDIHRIVRLAPRPLTASEIASELRDLNLNFKNSSNPLATVHAIMVRLTESGRVHETVKGGKKAWERMTRMAETFRKAPKRATAKDCSGKNI
jgi:hypothetical protein